MLCLISLPRELLPLGPGHCHPVCLAQLPCFQLSPLGCMLSCDSHALLPMLELHGKSQVAKMMSSNRYPGLTAAQVGKYLIVKSMILQHMLRSLPKLGPKSKAVGVSCFLAAVKHQGAYLLQAADLCCMGTSAPLAWKGALEKIWPCTYPAWLEVPKQGVCFRESGTWLPPVLPCTQPIPKQFLFKAIVGNQTSDGCL